MPAGALMTVSESDRQRGCLHSRSRPQAAAARRAGGNAADAAVVPAPSVLRDAPGEVLADSQEEHYLEYRAMTDMREPYRCGGGR